MMLEAGEVVEHFQWQNLELAEVKQQKKNLIEIQKELADVLIYSLELSILLGFDTEKIIRDKLVEVAKKYPAKLMRSRMSADSGFDDAYYHIKQKYRLSKKK